ncbi:hypothetical protein K0M31_001892 [Melipona bicolor]|uniref:Uncharacterized protein n=1 Tax=Melipona bicolor TaxID=60889 RepID=A0AA40GHJ7_9HYME|nr:hypothetical protein K0M31_001892 [Melipona bicolor]
MEDSGEPSSMQDEEGKWLRTSRHLGEDFLSLQGQTFSMAAAGPQFSLCPSNKS